ncbi:cytochrome c-type biogenesis protein CcmH [Candidatus Pelagibacter sp.]|jgi:cytochrome c-type biogenesis protein CcmH|nr:cytochrome c-type biogenesis protein CcmH [Candidatus Pelagibacter sp.]MDC2973596.1 cytochrome c-type biogenesis protein CcmH [Candidatus Pelagibacter sp.]MDC3020093.1 cytochrome c-type biogenesis protein CcmH [Candidatus Pelagibacter sp.]MDC3043498.1 cytochrome c-type biogenesis protein CcmH [Candidatus Pelagibacter sp.]OCW77261.1 cytochrome c heme lyase subunit CcmL [Pelagibacteraceae bacterium GOM-A1]|tara:strand:+ start:35 stop:394 length:360 start_codon:yes stop_codon:yes gene_type:complete
MLKILKLILLLYFSFNFSYANEINTKVDQITKNLRCLICQGQSVYDSQSDFAVSMKLVVKNKIDEGKEEEEIYDYLKNKYGEWIVYEPELNQNTFLLWSIPLILFAFGGLLIIRKVSIK